MRSIGVESEESGCAAMGEGLRVFFDHQIFIAQVYGGISRYFSEIIPRVADDGIEAEVWQGASINRYGIKSMSRSQLRVRGMQVPNIPRAWRLRNWYSSIGLRLLMRPSRNTIYHPTFYGAQASSWPGQTVLTVYDLTFFLFPEFFSKPLHKTITDQMRSSIAHATALIAISETTASDLTRLLGIERSRIRVIHLGAFQGPEGDESSPFPEPYILYVGERGGYKNYRSLREAYERTPMLFKNFTLVCCGNPSPTAEEVPSQGRSRFVSGDDRYLATLYRHASAMVYPSQYEGFGFPLLEAMRHRTPIVAAPCGSIPEIGAEAVWYSADATSDAIAAALLSLLDDPAARERLISAGTRRVAQFSWEKCASGHIALYRELGS